VQRDGWVTLGTQWTVATADACVAWVRDRLAPQLRKCDTVVLDTLRAQKDPRVRWILQASGAKVPRPAAVIVRLQRLRPETWCSWFVVVIGAFR